MLQNEERGRDLDEALRQVFSRNKGHDSLEREFAGTVNARLRSVECGLDTIAKALLVHKVLTEVIPSRPQDYDTEISLPVYKSRGQLPVPREATLNSQRTNCNDTERERERKETRRETARAPVGMPGPK